MLEAGGECLDLQSLPDRGRLLAPCNDFRNLYGRYQILLQSGQRGIGTDLLARVAAFIVTAGQ